MFFPNSGAINYARAYAINSVGVSYGETVSYTIPTHLNIGDFYQGGYVVYLDQTLQHGLIVSPNDQSTGIAWNDQPDVVTSATGTAVGTGESNTGYILFNQGNGSFAAKLCYDLVEGGYIDWFLPSIDEIRFAIDFLNPLVYDSSSISKDYWTSSEVNISQAKALNAIFTIDGHYYQERTEAKSKLKRVRAMRKF